MVWDRKWPCSWADIVDKFRNFQHEVCWFIFVLMFHFKEILYIVNCVGLDIEVFYQFKFDDGPSGDVNIQSISGVIKPVNRLASEGRFEISGCSFN